MPNLFSRILSQLAPRRALARDQASEVGELVSFNELHREAILESADHAPHAAADGQWRADGRLNLRRYRHARRRDIDDKATVDAAIGESKRSVRARQDETGMFAGFR
jgi:hypothetical protein